MLSGDLSAKDSGMASGRVIYRDLCTSQRFVPLSKEAKLLYILSYLFADDWGHLPYCSDWLQINCFPNQPQDLSNSMQMLVDCMLWDTPYNANSGTYVHIHNFEIKNRIYLGKRRRGIYPDETGTVPYRSLTSDKKLVPIDQCIDDQQKLLSVASSNLITEEVFTKDVFISGKRVNKTLLNLVCRKVGNPYDTQKVFFRARKSDDIRAWVIHGLTTGYATKTCPEEEDSKLFSSWQEEVFYGGN